MAKKPLLVVPGSPAEADARATIVLHHLGWAALC